MKNLFSIMAVLFFLIFCLPPAALAEEQNFPAGSLIIPMDTNGSRTNQNSGMWHAYGAVYRLLQNGIPVHIPQKDEEVDL